MLELQMAVWSQFAFIIIPPFDSWPAATQNYYLVSEFKLTQMLPIFDSINLLKFLLLSKILSDDSVMAGD